MTNTKIDGKQPNNALILQAIDEGPKVNVFVNFTELNESASFNIYKQAYNEDKNEYEDDAEVFDGALDKLEQLGIESDKLEEFRGEDIAELQKVADELIMQEAQLYFNGERASFKPIKAFHRFDPITSSMFRELKQARKDGTIFKTLPIVDYKKGLRFNILFTGEIEGSQKNVRISQIVDPENDEFKHGVKYRDKQIDGFLKQLEEDQVNENVKEQFEKSVDQLIERMRAKKVEELSQVFGVEDFDQAIEDEEEFYVQIEEVNTVGSANDPSYFVVVNLATKEDFEAQQEG